MPRLKASDIRKMSREEREKLLKELRIELIRLRGQVARGVPLENPSRLREVKRTIARILTINREEQGVEQT
ncbi:MAG: 50S ribosomal protein L29 [Thermoprotei archaeon]|nr:MAG: 50S ribosomal protein L29 [Thermoprotei archaeon]RLE88747.1 MAG: 50S ribosomal protein L29 [Thermoprotei archaeon]